MVKQLPQKSAFFSQQSQNQKSQRYTGSATSSSSSRRRSRINDAMQNSISNSQFLLSNGFMVERFAVRIFDPFRNNQHPFVSDVKIFCARQRVITCAKKSKGLFGSKRSRKSIMQLVNFAATNLDVLPEPLSFVIREFGGGNGGGGGGSWKGFGWGGLGGGGGGNRKKNVKKMLGFWFWVLAILACLGFWGLILEGELEFQTDALLGALALFLGLVGSGCVPEWVLGFCGGAVFVGLLMHRREDLRRLVKGFKARGIARRRR